MFLAQVVIENQAVAYAYDDITVDQGSAVRPDMFFDKPQDHLYVMTANKARCSRECFAIFFYSGYFQCNRASAAQYITFGASQEK